MRYFFTWVILSFGLHLSYCQDPVKKIRDSADHFRAEALRYGRAGQSDSSIMNSLEALRLYEKLDDKKEIAFIDWALAAMYAPIRQYEKANQYVEHGLPLAKAVKDWQTVGLLDMAASSISVNKNGGYTIDVYNYNREAYQYFEMGKDTAHMGDAMNNMGTYFSESKNKNYDSAIHYYSNALAIYTKLNRRNNMSLANDNIARLYYVQKKYAEAKNYALASAQIAKPQKFYEILKKNYSKLVNIYAHLNQPDSVYFYNSAYEHLLDTIFSNRAAKNLSEAETRYETEKKRNQIALLSKADSIKTLQISNQQLALNESRYRIAQQRLTLADDSLSIAKQQKQLLQNELEDAQKEKKIEALNRQSTIQQLEINNRSLALNRKNLLLFTVIAISVLAALSGFLFYKRFKIAREKQLQEAVLQQQELATRGILDAEENERKRIASDLHDGVGQMMSAAKMNLSAIESNIDFKNQEQRASFERVIAMVDESCREVRSVSHNMMPNALIKSSLAGAVREFINQIDGNVIKVNLYTEGLNEKLDTNIETVLYRVIQECVNNVIRHSNANLLDISLVRDQDGIAATIEDNGTGFHAASVLKNGEGLGLKNIQTRISYLKGTVEWDSANGKGTVVAIHVPVV